MLQRQSQAMGSNGIQQQVLELRQTTNLYVTTEERATKPHLLHRMVPRGRQKALN